MAKITQGIGKKLNPSEARASISLHKIAQKKACCNASLNGMARLMNCAPERAKRMEQFQSSKYLDSYPFLVDTHSWIRICVPSDGSWKEIRKVGVYFCLLASGLALMTFTDPAVVGGAWQGRMNGVE